MGTVLWVECFFLFLEFNRMSRYEKSYRHINSQCEKKQKVIFSFRFWKRRRVCVRERERHSLEILGQLKPFVICINLHLQ